MPESSPKSELRESLVKYAGKILTGRPYFRFKLRQKLFLRAEKLGFSDAASVIDSILDDLARSGYLDDQYLAEAYVRRQLAKGYGAKIIGLKLKYLGLPSAIVSRVLKSEATVEAETTAVQKYCRKFARLDRRRLASKLYTRGFSGSIIQKLFDVDLLAD